MTAATRGGECIYLWMTEDDCSNFEGVKQVRIAGKHRKNHDGHISQVVIDQLQFESDFGQHGPVVVYTSLAYMS